MTAKVSAYPTLLAAARALGFHGTGAEPVAKSSFRLHGLEQTAFVKLVPIEQASSLSAEADGLHALEGPLQVPRVLGYGETGAYAWLALEWLQLSRPNAETAAAFGRALAESHRHTAPAFGWEQDNFIGPIPQANAWLEDWPDFFSRRRLAPQLAAARQKGAIELAEAGEHLCTALRRILADHRPEPSLVHGDLWSGNWGALADGTPVTFDPAVHYADRECDLAMTELFGGFPDAFYTAYSQVWPLSRGYELRRSLYQLYHVLNHFNIFGGLYERQALLLIEAVLRHG